MKGMISRAIRGASQGLAVENSTVLRVNQFPVGTCLPLAKQSQSVTAVRQPGRQRLWEAVITVEGTIVEVDGVQLIRLLPETVGYAKNQRTAYVMALAELARRNQPGLPPLRHGGRLVEEEVTG